jgi:galactosylceramidase
LRARLPLFAAIFFLLACLLYRNERGYSSPSLATLRSTRDAAGFTTTKIIVADSSFSVAGDINKDPAFAAVVWGLGAHYPNMQSGAAAEATGKQLWASEEDSTYNNAVGAGCWARVINQNYVRGNMSASINWNLLSAYMKGQLGARRTACGRPRAWRTSPRPA